MNASRFFRYVWRVDAVFIFVIALISAGFLCVLAAELLIGGHGANEQAVDVNPEPETAPEPPVLGNLNPVRGAPVLRGQLNFGHRFRGVKFGSGSGDTYSTRNYLFLDVDTLESRWLFPDNRRLVVDSDELLVPVVTDESGTGAFHVIAFSYRIVDSDTDGDRQLTPEDEMTLAYSRPDGSGYTSVITGIDRILGTESCEGGTKHVVAFEADGKWQTATVSLRTFEIEKQGEIPKDIS